METFSNKDISLIQKKIPFNRNGKILSVSHWACMDGTISTIPIYNSYNKTTYLKCTPGKVDEALHSIDGDDYDVIMMTDISFKDFKMYDRFKNLILIDHHGSAADQHDPSQMRFVYQGNSAGVLTRKFMSKYTGNNFDYLTDLSVLGEDYDLWLHKDKKSRGLQELHHHYKCDKFINRFGRGDVEFNADEKMFIEQRQKSFNKLYNNLKFWELETINACMIIESDFINDLCHKLLKERGFDIVICKNPSTASCSIRSDHETLDIGEILKKLEMGGGHAQAGGFAEKEPFLLQKKLLKFEEEVYNNFENIRIT